MGIPGIMCLGMCGAVVGANIYCTAGLNNGFLAYLLVSLLSFNFYQVINGQFRIHCVKHHVISLHGFHFGTMKKAASRSPYRSSVHDNCDQL